MLEIIEFMHPYLSFITLAIFLANSAYQISVKNDLEKLKSKAIELDFAEYEKDTGKWVWK